MASPTGLRKQLLLLAVVAAMAAYAYLTYVHAPLAAQLAKAAKENAALRQEVAGLEGEPINERDIRQAIAPLDQQAKELKEQVDALAQSRLAGQEALDQTVYQVNEAAGNNLLLVSELAPAPPDKLGLPPAELLEHKKLGRSFHKVRCSGDFLGFFGFVRDLSGLDRLVNLTGLTITQSSATDGSVEVEFVLVI